ncbi:hypothetical protein BDB01DRAFT_838564 [Pilobolus umbonatus]|nr:hypothetical protein BDB01DRAFT_838564 [Pilobolus umbonatus]
MVIVHVYFSWMPLFLLMSLKDTYLYRWDYSLEQLLPISVRRVLLRKIKSGFLYSDNSASPSLQHPSDLIRSLDLTLPPSSFESEISESTFLSGVASLLPDCLNENVPTTRNNSYLSHISVLVKCIDIDMLKRNSNFWIDVHTALGKPEFLFEQLWYHTQN